MAKSNFSNVRSNVGKNTAQKSKFTFLKYLTFTPEARTEEPRYPSVGRFKYFRAVYKQYSAYLFILSLMAALFFLPSLIAFAYVQILGIENFSYTALTLGRPYLLDNVGFGLSSGDALSAGLVNILYGRKIQLVAIGIFLPLGGLGLAGLYHVVNKMFWVEKFSHYKVDKFGNSLPCVYREFFIGIKKFWLPMVAIMTVVGGMFVGTSFAICNLLDGVAMGTASAGDYIGAVVASIVSLYILLTSFTMLPMSVQYKQNFFKVLLKNATLFDLSMFLPLAFIGLALCLLCFISTTSNLFLIIFFVFVVFIGLSLFAMVTVNFSQYLAEKIVTPVYEAQKISESRKNNKKKNAKWGN